MEWNVGITLPMCGRIVERDLLESIRHRGFETLGIAIAPGFTDWPTPKEVDVFSRDLFRLDLQVNSVHTSLHDENGSLDTDPVQRARRIGSVTRAIDLLCALEGKICVVDVGAKADAASSTEEDLAVMRAAQGLTRIAEQCRKRGLAIAIEAPLASAREGDPADGNLLRWMLQRFPSVCLDLSYSPSSPGMLEPLRAFAQRIVQIQISGAWLTETTRSVLNPAWRGCFDFFRSIQFRGAFMLEAPSTGDVLADVDLAALNANRFFPGWGTAPKLRPYRRRSSLR